MDELNGMVVFNNININSIQINSGVFIGDNYQVFWSANHKSNVALGPITGRNFINKPLNYIYDPDHIDYLSVYSPNHINNGYGKFKY